MLTEYNMGVNFERNESMTEFEGEHRESRKTFKGKLPNLDEQNEEQKSQKYHTSS